MKQESSASSAGQTDSLLKIDRIAYNTEEACAALGMKRTALWRAEARGLLHAVPDIGTKLYSIDELKRFINRKAS